MAEKNIQMQRKNADGTFDLHYPITKVENVAGAAKDGDLIAHKAEEATNAHLPKNVGLGNVTNDKQMPIAGGTFTGVAVAHNNTSYTIDQVHNIRLYVKGTTVPTLPNGVIALIYE